MSLSLRFLSNARSLYYAAILLLVVAMAGCRGGAPVATNGTSAPPATLLSETEVLLANLQANETGEPNQFPSPKLLPQPSNDRDWLPELATLAYAEKQGDELTIHNVRNAEFLTYRDCLVDYYDKTYDLTRLQTVDFIVIPFADNPAIAHTMLSFGFGEGEYVGVSAEVRLEKGESYDAAVGLFGQFELIYVIADERDLVRARTEHRNCDVYIYRTKATPEQARRLFLDVLKRVNQLRDKPEFYDTFRNNCTTNIVRHINTISPGKIPYDFRILLPGFADQLAYELGLIDNSLPYAEVKRRARVNEIAHRYKDDPQFSAKIRGENVLR